MWPTGSPVFEEVAMLRKPSRQQLLTEWEKAKDVKEDRLGSLSKVAILVTWGWLEPSKVKMISSVVTLIKKEVVSGRT